MYKPNGEEPMTKQEEMRRREAVAGRKAERISEEPKGKALRAAFYAALFGSSSSREIHAEAVFEQAQ
jgi:hypothetical protein